MGERKLERPPGRAVRFYHDQIKPAAQIQHNRKPHTRQFAVREGRTCHPLVGRQVRGQYFGCHGEDRPKPAGPCLPHQPVSQGRLPSATNKRNHITGVQPEGFDQLHQPRPPMVSAISAFCTCSRFSASSYTTDCGPSITSSVTS